MLETAVAGLVADTSPANHATALRFPTPTNSARPACRLRDDPAAHLSKQAATPAQPTTTVLPLTPSALPSKPRGHIRAIPECTKSQPGGIMRLVLGGRGCSVNVFGSATQLSMIASSETEGQGPLWTASTTCRRYRFSTSSAVALRLCLRPEIAINSTV